MEHSSSKGLGLYTTNQALQIRLLPFLLFLIHPEPGVVHSAGWTQGLKKPDVDPEQAPSGMGTTDVEGIIPHTHMQTPLLKATWAMGLDNVLSYVLDLGSLGKEIVKGN